MVVGTEGLEDRIQGVRRAGIQASKSEALSRWWLYVATLCLLALDVRKLSAEPRRDVDAVLCLRVLLLSTLNRSSNCESC